ncbi:MAG: hypothetical protein M1822_009075 [Bathelium mastoideum]|nr:MAG: hypothetical protein M1822_009075 [Bathelium mastoideum]
MEEDIGVVAYLYPEIRTEGSKQAANAIGLKENEERFVAPRNQKPPLATHYNRHDRAATEDPDKHDSLEYEACLKIDVNQIPKTRFGLVAGRDPRCDLLLPELPGISFHHFSVTFNNSFHLVVQDLNSRIGTSVIYGDEDGGPRIDFQWIVGGDEILKEKERITIRVTQDLQFRIVVKACDINSEAFRAKVDRFRAGTAGLEDMFGDIGVRDPTQLPSAVRTPSNGDIFLEKKKLGEGTFAIVNRAWNVTTGQLSAVKRPREELQERDIKAWENEALLMSRSSHNNIVKLLSSELSPSPLLRFEYLPGGSIRQQLKDGKPFSAFERVHILRQTTSALAYLHELKPSITHRDLSEGNILVSYRGPAGIEVKLGDFGLSKEGQELKTIVGTPYFFPPEFAGKEMSSVYTKAVEIWAPGAVLAKLTCGFPKWRDEHRYDGSLWCMDIRRRLEDYLKKNDDDDDDELAHLLLGAMLCMQPQMRKEARECHQMALQLPEGSRNTESTENPALSSPLSSSSSDSDGETATPRAAAGLGKRKTAFNTRQVDVLYKLARYVHGSASLAKMQNAPEQHSPQPEESRDDPADPV